MTHAVLIRGLILVLALALLAPPAFAAGDREPAGPSVRGVLSALWQALVDLIPGVEEGSASYPEDDSGPGMDPNG